MNKERAQELLPCIQYFAENGEIEIRYGDEGRFILRDNPTWEEWCEYRIPVTKDTVRWDVLPDWVMYVARWKHGVVMMFDQEPRVAGISWESYLRNTVSMEIPLGFKIHTPGTCDWKDSLIKRPENANE